ncbi:MAG: integrase/recombinase XerD [Campylobacterota bacterium]|nr:integrase/recombinase XerD [Campylobacterota bacterium]
MLLKRGNASYDFDRWYKSYFRHLKHQEVASNTFETYSRLLNNLGLFIAETSQIKNITDMNKDFFLLFIEHLEEKSKVDTFEKKTKATYVAILKAFFTYIEENSDPDEEGVIYSFSNEFKGLVPKKANKRKKIKHLSDDEIYHTLAYVDQQVENRGNHYSYIHALAVKLMVYAGLRVSEMLDLRLGDIVGSDLVNENGGKDFYEVHLRDPKSAEEQMVLVKKNNIEKEFSYFKLNIDENDYIFKGIGSKKNIDRSGLYRMIKGVFEKAGVNRKGLHILRHTFAVKLYRDTKDILVAKEMLRHSSIDTTMIYVTVEKIDIAKALR